MNRRLILLLALLVLAALVTLLRLPALPYSVVDWDESVYLLMARSLLQGHAPYTVVWDHKPPGLYALFAAAQVAFGPTVLAIRWLGIVAVMATSWLLLVYGRAALGSWAVGGSAAVMYALFSTRNGGLATNAEILFAPWTVAALLLLTHTGAPAALRLQRGTLFMAGLLFGCALQIKTAAAGELLAALTVLLLTLLFSRARGQAMPARRVLAAAAWLLLGAALPTLVAAATFAASGHWADYLYANVTANARYLRAAPPVTMTALAAALWAQVRSTTALWLALPLAGLVSWRTRVSGPVAMLWLWLGGALLAVLAAGRLFPHYFLQLLPPLCLLAAWTLVQGVQLSPLPRRWQPVLLGLLAIVALGQPLAHSARTSSVEAWARIRHTPRTETLAYIGAYLRRQLQPGETFLVADGEPVLYFLAGVDAPTRYVLPALFYDEGLAALLPVEPLDELDRIMTHPPRYVVLSVTPPRISPYFVHLHDYLVQKYTLERSIQGVMLYRRVN